MRLLVAGDFRWNSGSSHVIREYVRHGPAVGMEVAVSVELGSRDALISAELPYCADIGWATHLLVVLEGNPFLKEKDLEKIERVIPKSRRAVVDADGHWAPATRTADDDNMWPCGQDAWRQQISSAADLILQPALVSASAGAVSFPYFGMPTEETGNFNRIACRDDLDIQYIGNNWFRSRPLIQVFSAARRFLGNSARLRVCGKYWDGSVRKGFESATKADLDALERLRVDICPPVPFGTVVSHMGEAAISPVLVRPLLSKLGFLTPRMLETVSASTIPVYRQEDSYIASLYKDSGRLCLGKDASGLGNIFHQVPDLCTAVNDLRQHLRLEYSYPSLLKRLRQLMT